MLKTIALTALLGTAPFLHGVIGQTVTTPCAQEDSINCFWDAGNAGNGVGHSFYSVRVGNKMCTIYTDRAYNRRMGSCTLLDGWRPFRNYEGHTECAIKVGPTSIIRCGDWQTTS
jgi:hypothetical protein